MKNIICKILCLSLALVALLTGCGSQGGSISTSSDSNESQNGEVVSTSNPIERENYYYQNAYEYGASAGTAVKFGVINNCNLFAPDDEIKYYFELSTNKLDGKNATVEFVNDELGVHQSKSHTLDFGGESKKIFEGSIDTKGLKNGIYTFKLTIADFGKELSFVVGVVPKAKRANKDFLYGVQPYVTNTYGGSNYLVQYQDMNNSVDSIFSTIDWMGANVVREDGISWKTLQPSADAKYDCKPMDKYIDLADALDMDFMWIIGTCADWAVRDEDKSETTTWNLPPKLEYWKNRITTIAEHYKNYDNLIYEIWNEADWEFFNGTEKQYFELLNSACDIISKTNPKATIIPSALVSNWELSQENAAHAKNSVLYYEAYKPLLEKGILKGINVHDHTLFSKAGIFSSIERRETRLKNAGYKESEYPTVYVTESGVWGDDQVHQSVTLVDKMLYYRADGAKSFVAYDFRDKPNSVGQWTMFTDTLQPKLCIISYTTLVNFLGNAEFKEQKLSSTGASYADIYFDGEKTIVPVYTRASEADKLTTSKAHKAYDIYGNEIKATGSYIADKEAIYLVFDGEISASDITFKALV